MGQKENTIATEPSFRGKQSLAIRIWHWSMFIIICGSLLTVLLAKTLFSVSDNIPLIQDNLKENGIVVSSDQAKEVAHEYNDKLWDWHVYFGYVLSGLFLFRILLEFFQLADQKFLRTIKNALKYFRQPGGNNKRIKHYLFVRYLYLAFYLVLGIMACTGLFMEYSDDVENLRAWRQIAKSIHEAGLYAILTFLVIHIGGALIAEFGKKHKGVISDMFNGGE